MVVSILFFMFIIVGAVWLRMLLRILLIPVIAGLSYELIRFLGSHDGKLVYVISRPGMWLQHLTTREPEKEMVEVAIASVNAVFDWREFQGKAAPEEPEAQTVQAVPVASAAAPVAPEDETEIEIEDFDSMSVEDIEVEEL